MTRVGPRRVLITGGTGSLGRALVRAFSELGDAVTFQYNTNVAAASELESRFAATPLHLSAEPPVPSDLTFDFDVLVNNAAVNVTAVQPHEVSWSDWRLTLAVNLDFPFLLIQRCLPYMTREHWGRIVNISSIWGLRSVTENLPYTVSKHAMKGLTGTVAKEYASQGVTCNEICPGPIYSDMINRIAKAQAQLQGTTSDAYIAELESEVPSGRLATPEEIASLSVFLASEAAAQINGTSIPVDGAYIA